MFFLGGWDASLFRCSGWCPGKAVLAVCSKHRSHLLQMSPFSRTLWEMRSGGSEPLLLWDICPALLHYALLYGNQSCVAMYQQPDKPRRLPSPFLYQIGMVRLPAVQGRKSCVGLIEAHPWPCRPSSQSMLSPEPWSCPSTTCST